MKVEQLARKVARLIELNRRLKADNERYAIERERFLNEKKEQERRIAELKERTSALELAGGLILSEKGTGDRCAPCSDNRYGQCRIKRYNPAL